MSGSYAINQLVHLTAAFTVSGVATDPTAVTVKITDPAGVKSSPAAVKDSTGNYHCDFTVTVAGRHFYRFEGSGTCQAASEQFFDVATSST